VNHVEAIVITVSLAMASLCGFFAVVFAKRRRMKTSVAQQPIQASGVSTPVANGTGCAAPVTPIECETDLNIGIDEGGHSNGAAVGGNRPTDEAPAVAQVLDTIQTTGQAEDSPTPGGAKLSEISSSPPPDSLNPEPYSVLEAPEGARTEPDNHATAQSLAESRTDPEAASASVLEPENSIDVSSRDLDHQSREATAKPVGEYKPSVRKPRRIETPEVRKASRPRDALRLSIDLRLVFETGGFARLSFLPQRLNTLPQRVVVLGPAGEIELVALQEDWYQDLFLANNGELLRNGLVLQTAYSNDSKARWSMGGREVYVFTSHEHLSGFVNVPRLVIGEENVVLCEVARTRDVLIAIAETGSPEPKVVDDADGIPIGWGMFRGIVPQKAPSHSPSGNILDVLLPLPDAEIVLSGGIRIGRSSWLANFPPDIRLRGVDSSIELRIDGQPATKVQQSGKYTANGWDLVGDHTIWCGSGSRSYSIENGLEAWPPWDAYRWSFGASSLEDTKTRPAVCGVTIRPPKPKPSKSRCVITLGFNSILIGTAVGEIEYCLVRRFDRITVALGFPAFDPVWSLPSDPLGCNKSTARISLVGESCQPLHPPFSVLRRRWGNAHSRDVRHVRAWCKLILDASRKGLRIEPDSVSSVDLWHRYKKTAKAVWRLLR
jgi:hypothetical protein